MMFEHLGQQELAARVRTALVTALKGDVRTPDLGGSATTAEFAERIVKELV
jgi:isocitrate/isopropylmalate dehydrogenase